MQKIYLLVIASLLTIGLYAQNDTLLWQNFQNDIPNMIDVPEFDSLGTNNWINYDEDGLDDANTHAQNWDFSLDFYQQDWESIPAADTNFVFSSSSWLNGLLDGNRNWLITPPIEIVDDQAMLHFKSAPFQGPRYMDGYSVLVSTATFSTLDFADTLFRHKQMLPPLPAGAADVNQNALNVDSFLFGPDTYVDYNDIVQEAYIHDNGYSGSTYTSWDTVNMATSYTAILEPHSFSLAKYEGETIYIAILHDSDDDNLISVDDILVTGTAPPIMSNTTEQTLDLRYVLYPNPATHVINLSYRLKEKAGLVYLSLFDAQGKVVHQQNGLDTSTGEYTRKVDVRHLASGSYTAVLQVDGQQVTKPFVKQ